MHNLPGNQWFRFLNNIPETFQAFGSRADALAYAYSMDKKSGPPVIVTIVSMRSSQPCQLSKVEFLRRNSLHIPDIFCSPMHLKDVVILGIERFNHHGALRQMDKGMMKSNISTERCFCETPFDAPTPQFLMSKRQARRSWHQTFMSNLENLEYPTVTDLYNWIIGYCSYYQAHKGEAGQKKAEAIRDLMQLVRASLYRADEQALVVEPSIEMFLNHRPRGANTSSLHDLINDRRDKKSGKNSWGWGRIQEAFLEPQEELRHHKGCGY